MLPLASSAAVLPASIRQTRAAGAATTPPRRIIYTAGQGPAAAGRGAVRVKEGIRAMMDAQVETVADEGEQAEERQKRSSVWTTLGIGALVIIIVLIFLLLWDPWGSNRAARDEGRHPGLVGTVDGLPESSAYVGIWLKPGKSIESVLRRHGLPDGGVVFQNEAGGYYVVSAGDRDVAAVVKELKADTALYDAGRVYEQDATGTP